MKKNQADSSRTVFNRKNQHTSPTHFPKKQFEFIYREKDHLPSSEAFQSIIFMKSKKCQAKSHHSAQKSSSKGKKPQVEDLKHVISQIQKQLNQQQTRQSKRIQQNGRSQVLKNTFNSVGNVKKVSNDNYKNKSSHRLVNAQKVDICNSENVKNYKNLLSPSKVKGKKTFENQAKSSKFANSTQQTFRKNTKVKEKRKIKKDNILPSSHFEEPQEYILVGDEFVTIDFKQAEALEQKLLSSRAYIDLKLVNQQIPKRKYSVESPIAQDQQAERIFQQYLMSDDKSSQPTPLHISKYEPEIFMENNLIVVQKYLVSKIKIIQRWWRKMLEKSKERNPPSQHNSLEDIDLAQNSKVQDNQTSELNQNKFEFCNKMIGTENFGSSSPIKLVDQFFWSNTNCQTQVVHSRQVAAKMQLQTHKNILQKLLITKKITPQVYIQRKEMIGAKYYSELQQIQQLRKIIQQNVNRAAEIQKKTQQDFEAVEKGDIIVNNNLLDKIFGVEFAECFEQQMQNEKIMIQVPELSNQFIVNREKSTGCHYQTQNQFKKSFYKKQNQETQDYDEDFQEYNQQNENTAEFKQFCTQNVTVGQTINPNFKELFNQFKLRQQVKMEIDKRAAIQMGVLIQDIPQQIKNQLVGIDTSLNSIHRFLLAFFKFYIFYNKYDFLRLINMPYGYNIQKRIKNLQGYCIEDSFEEDEDGVIYGLDTIIPQQIFEQFYEKVYALEGQRTSVKIANFQFQKVHNKVLFDCFNQSLNYFRPYFVINGPPYPWNYSEKALTFYFIAQENIQEVFEKTQLKVLKWASNLCGLIVNKFSKPSPPLSCQKSAQQLVQQIKQVNHPLLSETREDRLNKNQKVQIIESQNEWNNFMEQQTANSLNISQSILNKLIEEMALAMIQKDAESPRQFVIENKKQEQTGTQFFQNISQNSSFSEFQIF